jgi:uncharacterized protein YrrD
MPVSPENLRHGADVFSSEGEKLGALHRVVVKRNDLSLTHVVVDIGFLRSGRRLWEGGLGLDYDRLVPFSAVTSATDDRLELALTVEEFRAMPEYTEESFEEPEDMSPGEFDITDVANRAEQISSIVGSVSGNWLVTRLRRPLDAADITEDTAVWREEPHEKLGEVQRVLLDDEGRVKALVIKRGFLLKEDVVLPARYIVELMDEVLRVDITDMELDQLKRYETGGRADVSPPPDDKQG